MLKVENLQGKRHHFSVWVEENNLVDMEHPFLEVSKREKNKKNYSNNQIQEYCSKSGELRRVNWSQIEIQENSLYFHQNKALTTKPQRAKQWGNFIKTWKHKKWDDQQDYIFICEINSLEVKNKKKKTKRKKDWK